MHPLILITCCLIHLVIGNVYASSVLYQPILELTGWPEEIPKIGFCLTIIFLAIAPIVIRLVEHTESEGRVIMFAGLGYLLSQQLLWISVYQSSHFIFQQFKVLPYLIACSVMGFNIGTLYSLTIARVAQAKKHAGLFSGIVVACFAIGSLIAAQAYKYLLNYSFNSILNYVLISSLVLVVATLAYNIHEPINKIDIRSTFKERTTWILFLIFLINIFVGLTIIGNMVNISIDNGLNEELAVLLVGYAGLANGAGRLVWSFVCDFLKPVKVLIICLIIESIALFFSEYWFFSCLVIISCYGAGFALMPLICKDIFKENGALYYSAILLAWSLAAVFVALVQPVMNILLCMVIGAIILALTIKN